LQCLFRQDKFAFPARNLPQHAFGLTAIITESALSFLGVGFPSDFPTWGKLLSDAVSRMQEFPERVLLPGIAISLTVLSVNYLGDGLRDALDPRLRGR
jgi:peptide/nickel transport system permease protein